ncbi:velvet factor-domain-containing protein [Staphylotrichum tortipilum]|uniref:Velvet factor-domain-containing protein n=1 Tax=Staphylotrichum tortipilum TaxID=2831512 RepID=A0AAN6RSD3_9PEZI|nr:velvet factor-domain-containing protein [Staphylotrichum longicolle]
MSAAVDFAPHNFGRHTHLDGMAQHHHGYHEPYAPAHAHHYAQDQQFSREAPQHQPRQLPRLPSMATMIPPAASNPSPVLSNGSRDAPYLAGRPTYYSDYATPSPVGQTPPQLPIPNSDPHPMSKRAVDLHRSPTLSSTASDRSSEEMAHELRLRQMGGGGGGLHDAPHGGSSQAPVPRQLIHYPSPRSRGGSLQHDTALPPPVLSKPATTSSATSYSTASSTLNNRPPTTTQLSRSPPTTHLPTSPRQEPKSMSISNLLSTTTNPPSTAASGPSTTTPPTPPPAQNPFPSEYRITVRQQPSAARSCGFGERDRRVIDPPPIVQLTIHSPALSREDVARRLRHQFSVVHCSIWDEKGQRDMSSMPEDFRQQRRLMGTLVASPFVGVDEKGEEGCFFCFPDLSCRTPGVFRLKFALVVLDPARMCSGERSAIVATAMSECFQVYNAKDFPGMQASTGLTKRLKEQGCLISIKKGNEGKRETGGGKGRGEEGEDEEDGDEEGDEEGDEGVGSGAGEGKGKGRARKRARR